MTYLLVGIAGVAMVARVVALETSVGSRLYGSVAAWTGLVVGAAILGWGAELGVTGSEIGVALAMAAGASLVAVDGVEDLGAVARGSEYAVVAVGAVIVAGSGWATAVLGHSPWPGGALLVAAHWCCLAASLGAGVAGFGAVGASSLGEVGDDLQGGAVAHQCAGRAVGFLWLGWAVAQLVHWRLLGVPGLGSRSEWFGLGVVLVATGSWIVGLPRAEAEPSALRRRGSAVAVPVVLLVGLALAWGFGAPLQLSLGA